MTVSEIERRLCFSDIMTNEIFCYNHALDEVCKTFCKKRNITYLPSKKHSYLCYKLIGDEFKEEKIGESQKVRVDDHIFDNSVLEKFKKHHVLFVYREKKLKGVIHFSDYNRNPVFINIYALLIEFEKKIRELLISHDYNNNDMLEYFKNHQKNKHFKKKLNEHTKPSKQKEMEELEPFQTFYLIDLIRLVCSKKIIRIPESINDFRNAIMHRKNVVKYENFEKSTLIYSFKSFKEFFKSINSLKSEIETVSKKIRPRKESEEVTKLKNASLFFKSTS